MIAFVAELFALQMKKLTPMISKMISKESAPIEVRRPVGREVVSSPGRIIMKPKLLYWVNVNTWRIAKKICLKLLTAVLPQPFNQDFFTT